MGESVSSGLRIGIDATCLASRRGYGRFLRELLPPLLEEAPPHELVLFLDRHAARESGPLPARSVQPETSASQAGAASARGSRNLRDLWIMGRAVARERLDAFYFPSVYSYFPVPPRLPVAVSFHDTIPERYGRIVFPTRGTRLFWNAKVALARRQARALITVSEWSRRRLCQQFHLAPERVHVAGEAPSPSFAPADDPAPRRTWLAGRGLSADARYLIYVGGFNPHKNLGMLVDAFAVLCRDDEKSDVQLLLVGDHAGDVFHADVDALRGRIAAGGVHERVHFAGFVPDDELRHLYAGALALVLPSLEEGFGLSAVEAAACGTPCVATVHSPLPELLAGGGIFVHPEDAQGWRHALARIASEPELRGKLAPRALEAARSLSWRDAARVVRGVLETLAVARR